MIADRFDIPVVLFIFRRPEKSVEIIARISEVKPERMYLISDAGRTDGEKDEVAKCRKTVEEAIDWDCTVTKDYAAENKGVYDRIGLGALRILEKERWAIFLEDDNLPEISFFHFCREMLNRYEKDQEVLWICGTNYLENCTFRSGADYGFTRHMLPCGWASWCGKFKSGYDKDFSSFNRENLRRIRKDYPDARLYQQDIRNWEMEIEHLARYGRFFSWDYHMSFSIRVNGKVGIIPRLNQIRNIGVDVVSEHSSSSLDNVMVSRFCNISSYPLDFPLHHPETVECDDDIEERLAKVITAPITPLSIYSIFLKRTGKVVRRILKIPASKGVAEYLGLKR